MTLALANIQLATVISTTAVSLLGFYLLLLWRKEIEYRRLPVAKLV
ncbi:MAG: hypothetical protein R6X32_00515 [Chloroflexota bacterium]|jgi:hypothetical protein